MSKKNVYTFQFLVRDNESIKTMVAPFLALLIEILNSSEAETKYAGTVNSKSTFTVCTDNDPKHESWLVDLEEHVREHYSQYVGNMQTYYNYNAKGYCRFVDKTPKRLDTGKLWDNTPVDIDMRDIPW